MVSPTTSIGSANDVGRAQLKPIPSSHETSTMRLPGLKAASSSLVTNISGAPVCWSTQLTTMSNPARKAASGTGPSSQSAWQRPRSSASGSKCTIWAEWIGEATAVTSRWVRRWTSLTPCALRAVTPPAGRPEADDGRPEPLAVFTRRSDELHRMQHGAVTGKLVVLVKHMQAERAIMGPVVHRLKRDQRQPPVDGHLRDLLVLHAVRPSPQHLTLPELREILRQRLGEQDDIALRDELGTGAQTGDMRRQPLIGYAETPAVSAL